MLGAIPMGSRGVAPHAGSVLHPVVAVCLLAASLAFCGPTAAGLMSCESLPLEVEYHDTEALAEVCAAAAAAVEFLNGYGLQQKVPLLIVLVDRPITHRQQLIYGIYDKPRDRIEITARVTLERMDPPARMFGQLLSGPMFRSVVAHEVAHAVAQQNSRVPKLALISQEYLGFATLIGTLPEPERRAVIDRAGVGPWEVGDTISQIYLELGPHGFAVKSHLHLVDLVDPQGFIDRLLANEESSLTVR